MLTIQKNTIVKALLTLCISLAFFYIFDITIRFVKPAKGYISWGNSTLQYKLDELDKLYKKHGRIDVLTLGSSVGQGLDVGEWQRETDGKLICYNLNIPGFRSDDIEFVFSNYVYPKYKPKLVLYTAHPRFMFELENSADKQNNPEFWKSIQVRKLLADNIFAKLRLSVEECTYTWKTNRYLRYEINHGLRNDDDTSSPIDEYGVLHAVKWRQGLQKDKYSGILRVRKAIEHLSGISQTCKNNGSIFFLVNQEHSPSAWNNYPPGAKKVYRSGLYEMMEKGSVIDLPVTLKLTDSDFVDERHIASIGQDRIDVYLFNAVISPQLLKSESYLAHEKQVPFVKNTSEIGAGFSYAQLTDQWGGLMPSVVQIATETVGSSVTLGEKLSSGKYELVIYACNDMKSTVPLDMPHRIKVSAVDGEGSTLCSQEVEVSRQKNLYGPATRTLAFLDIPQNGVRLNVETTAIAKNKTLVLDSIGIRKMHCGKDEANLTSSCLEQIDVPIHANLIRNGNFDIPGIASDRKSIALNWWYYGTKARILPSKDTKGNVLEMAYKEGDSFAPVAQYLSVSLLQFLAEKKMSFSFDAQMTAGIFIRGTVLVNDPSSTGAETQKYQAAQVGRTSGTEWNHYRIDFSMPATVKSAKVDLRLGTTQGRSGYALIRDVKLEVME